MNPGNGRKAWIITPRSLWNDGLTFHTIHLFNNQKGTLDDVSENWDFAISDEATMWVAPGNYVVRLNYNEQTKVSTPVIMRNQNCIWKLTLEDESHNPINATKLCINDGFNDYTIFNNNQAASEFYVAMLPQDNKTFTFTATRSGKLYSKSYSGVTTVASNFYTSTVTMDGPEGVQLWEGGPYWATMNVGATNETEAGLYFAWGETLGYTKNEETRVFSYPDYKYSEDYGYTLTKYVPESKKGWSFNNEFYDNLNRLEPSDDAATVNWGNKWRMPTSTELSMLVGLANKTLVTFYFGDNKYNGVNGILVTGTETGYTNKSIFLPMTGILDSSGFNSERMGCYWSSELYSSDPNEAYYLAFYFNTYNSNNVVDVRDQYRPIGQAIRSVSNIP